ncbi:hypothetical protein AURDEDRAFT_159250 [Auricularia subglabra TFB-10046 SS5]|nr:hypothetical protein AURDEDRAFT_159250 [Auricularia subglabra TFB-10046 SS5]
MSMLVTVISILRALFDVSAALPSLHFRLRGLDFTLNHDNLPEDRPVIFVKHGLTGGSYEIYPGNYRTGLCSSRRRRSRDVRCRMQLQRMRGNSLDVCAVLQRGTPDDLRAELSFVRHLYPKALLIGLGCSLGANVITRYLAQEGDESLRSGVVIVACPWNLVDNSRHLHASCLQKHMYSKTMARNVIRVLRRHSSVFTTLPSTRELDHLLSEGLIEKILDINWVNGKTLADVDDTIVSNMGSSFAPQGPFPFHGVRVHRVREQPPHPARPKEQWVS